MLRRNSIFMKYLQLILIATLVMSIVLTVATSRIAERILLNQVTQNAKVNIQLIGEELLKYNEEIVNTVVQITISNAFKNYLTKPAVSSIDQLNHVIDLGRYIDTYKDYLSPRHTHFIVAGVGENEHRNYSSNALKWDRVPHNIIQDYMTQDGLIANKLLYHSSPDLFSATVPYDHYVFATKPLIDSASHEMYGYAVVIMDEKTIYDRYQPYLSDGVNISFISAEGYLLSSSHRDSTSEQHVELLQHIEHGVEEGQAGVKTNDKYSYISLYIPQFDAYLVQEIDQRIAFASLYQISVNIMKVVIILIVVLMCLAYLISKRITNPLYKLIDTMQKAKADSLSTQPLQEGGSYEMNVLTKTYNLLVKEIDRYTNKLLVEERERRKADLSALQMQINPHFLYNTLTSIKYLAKMNRIDDVDRTITSLSSMLEHTIGTTEDIVRVEQEIEALKHYVLINQVRYGDQVDMQIEVQQECKPLFIPKLIIQPFVENAFFHAFPSHRKGTIHLFVRLQRDRLLIEVLDDGVGSLHKREGQAKKRSVSGIGIDNVHHRIQLLYGQQYGVQIDSTSGYGTAVKITLPIITEQSIEP